MAVMRIPVVAWPCHAATGQIPVLKYLVPGARGHLWPCPIVLGIKYRCFLRSYLL
jgi:hypothetical protein